MAQAEPDVSRIPSGVTLTKEGERYVTEHATNAAEIAAKNDRARLSIGREIEELLRIRREADATAARLIDLLDLHEPDPDLEPSLGVGYPGQDDDREGDDSEAEPSLGWTEMEARFGRYEPAVEIDREQEHDGREEGHDSEGEGLVGSVALNPAYHARLRARRSAGKAVRP